MLETIVALTLVTASAVPVTSIATLHAAHGDTHIVADAEVNHDAKGVELELHAPLDAYLMVESLRRGGLVLFVRHGITSLDNVDQDDVKLSDCKTQRSLSSTGRALAMDVGSAVRELRLPIGYVFTSAYCRCRETADLMFGNGLRVADLAVSERNAEGAGVHLLSVMARMPSSEANTVIVGHMSSALQAYGVMPDEGEILVIDPKQGEQGPVLIGHITATQWSDIVRDYRKYGDRISEMVREIYSGEAGGAPKSHVGSR